METKSTIPNNVRAIARDAYRHTLMTGRTIGHCGDYTTQTQFDHNRVVVVSVLHNGRWEVPIAASWL